MADLELPCPNSPNRKHAMIVDVEDRRFKICTFCGRGQYRTDEELLKESKLGKRGT